MNPLYQRLRELDPKSFENLCYQLLRERHPGANIRQVEGASGDEAVDAFEGELDAHPTIWQFKAFANGIKDSQKEQIRASLRRAVGLFAPRRWILCLNVVMDISSHKWFERLAKSYEGKTEVGLMPAEVIINELTHRKSIRDAFFPGASLDPAELRALITRTALLNDAEQAALAQENATQLIERLKGYDARFNYSVSISPDRPPEPASRSGATFSVGIGSTTINAYPRDMEALRLDPPKVDFTLEGAGVTKFKEFRRTGKPQTFEPEEITELRASLPIFDLLGSEGVRVFSIKHSLRAEPLPLRLVFGADREHPVNYDYVPFQVIRVGTEEVELVSRQEGPFILSLVLWKKGIQFKLTEKRFGFSVAAADKYIRATNALSTGGRFELFDLETGKRLFSGSPKGDLSPSPLRGLARFFADAVQISEAFGVDLQLNRPLTEKDAHGVAILSGIVAGNGSMVENIHTKIGKNPNDERHLAKALAGELSEIKLEHPGVQVQVLDSTVNTGPFTVFASARLQDPEAAKDRWASAAEDASVDLDWQVVGSVEITRH